MSALVQTTPRRIRLRREKGWRLADATNNPNGVVNVARPSKWGNPYPVAKAPNELFSREDAVRMFRENLTTGEAWFDGHRFRSFKGVGMGDLDELRGKDLACFCPIGKPCHADVLLELANADREVTS